MQTVLDYDVMQLLVARVHKSLEGCLKELVNWAKSLAQGSRLINKSMGIRAISEGLSSYCKLSRWAPNSALALSCSVLAISYRMRCDHHSWRCGREGCRPGDSLMTIQPEKSRSSLKTTDVDTIVPWMKTAAMGLNMTHNQPSIPCDCSYHRCRRDTGFVDEGQNSSQYSRLLFRKRGWYALTEANRNYRRYPQGPKVLTQGRNLAETRRKDTALHAIYKTVVDWQ